MNYSIIKELHSSKIIVVKVGSNILVDKDQNIKKEWLQSLAKDIKKIRDEKNKVVIVSSGAIALGKKTLGEKNLNNLHDKQAAASIGQIHLSQSWQVALSKVKVQSSQILLTAEDLENRRKYLNARNTIFALLDLGVVPIINENDTTSTEEIRFGDNDKLSAIIANSISAEMLILLSDVNGLYTKDPKKNKNSQLLSEVTEINQTIISYVDHSKSDFGSGGMSAKIEAAKLCMQSGIKMIIANGLEKNSLKCINTKNSTWFIPQKNTRSRRHQWIWSRSSKIAALHIDTGAAKALSKNSSLLAIGVKKVEGKFYRGDTISVKYNSKEMARGIINYDFEDIEAIKGKKSSSINSILGFIREDEIIHKDNLVLIS